MAGESIASLLNNVWAAFRRAGITDDLRIIEQTAALLLEQEGVKLDSSLPALSVPQEFDQDNVRQQLEKASQQAGGAGVLFDRYILFRLDNMRPGGQYPTPRHIVRLMTALAETAGKAVADVACGSGGLLIHSQGSSLVGVDISPEWARIARANLQLHKKQGGVHEGNALRVVKSDERFERIVMNPPFGEKIASEFGTRSETALINLALNHLATNGRAALLAPGGVLFSDSSAEEKLRQRLVDDVTLEAIITLPNDAFQPYSTLTTHLLLIENKQPVDEGCTWFLRPVYDGYISGRGRDLTTDPKMPNDLTLVEQAVTAFRQPPAFQEGIPLAAQPLSENGTLLGYLVRPAAGVSLLSVRYLPAQGTEVQEGDASAQGTEVQAGLAATTGLEGDASAQGTEVQDGDASAQGTEVQEGDASAQGTEVQAGLAATTGLEGDASAQGTEVQDGDASAQGTEVRDGDASAQAAEPALFLLEVQQQEKRTFWKFASQASPVPEEVPLEEVEDAEKLVRERLGLKKKDPLSPPNVFQAQSIRWGSAEKQTVGGLMITFATERPQLMGVAIPRATLKARKYTLQPDDYLRPPEIRAELKRPHDTLLGIYQRQQELAQRMNRLTGWLVPQRSPEYSIPGKVDVQTPFGALSDKQYEIWQSIEGFKDGESARPFTAADIAVDGCTEIEKRLTLEMFEAMGLIVPITLKHPESGQLLNLYRLAESNDRWTGEKSNE
jgi:SAM-dependent methyltransferase